MNRSEYTLLFFPCLNIVLFPRQFFFFLMAASGFIPLLYISTLVTFSHMNYFKGFLSRKERASMFKYVLGNGDLHALFYLTVI